MMVPFLKIQTLKCFLTAPHTGAACAVPAARAAPTNPIISLQPCPALVIWGTCCPHLPG